MSNSNKSLSIGQVIYVLSNVKQKIVPAVVVEEIVVKKLDGNHVSWKVSFGPPGKERVIDSNRLDGEIYSSLDDIRDILYKRLSSFLDELVTEAEKKVETWYGQQVSSSRSESFSGTNNAEDNTSKIAPENLINDFETHAHAHSARETVPQNITVPQRNREKELLRNELRQKLQGDEESAESGSILETEEVVLPDGRKVRLNLRG